MAVPSVCGNLRNGQDNSCSVPFKKYYQQAVIINKSDIDPESIVKTKTANTEEAPCAYNVAFQLKEGATGYRFMGSEAGSSYKGMYNKTRDDLFSLPQYLHQVQILIAGVNETAKCVMESLDKGSFVVALQYKDGTVEIYGIDNGMVSADYTMDVQENGGGNLIVLNSLETAQEGDLPFVYKSTPAGTETEDFDSLFANPATP